MPPDFLSHVQSLGHTVISVHQSLKNAIQWEPEQAYCDLLKKLGSSGTDLNRAESRLVADGQAPVNCEVLRNALTYPNRFATALHRAQTQYAALEDQLTDAYSYANASAISPAEERLRPLVDEVRELHDGHAFDDHDRKQICQMCLELGQKIIQQVQQVAAERNRKQRVRGWSEATASSSIPESPAPAHGVITPQDSAAPFFLHSQHDQSVIVAFANSDSLEVISEDQWRYLKVLLDHLGQVMGPKGVCKADPLLEGKRLDRLVDGLPETIRCYVHTDPRGRWIDPNRRT
jgi:hypothetical protein